MHENNKTINLKKMRSVKHNPESSSQVCKLSGILGTAATLLF